MLPLFVQAYYPQAAATLLQAGLDMPGRLAKRLALGTYAMCHTDPSEGRLLIVAT